MGVTVAEPVLLVSNTRSSIAMLRCILRSGNIKSIGHRFREKACQLTPNGVPLLIYILSSHYLDAHCILGRPSVGSLGSVTRPRRPLRSHHGDRSCHAALML